MQYPLPTFPIERAKVWDRVCSIDVNRYAKTRNHIQGTVSYLSPYLTRGVLSLPEVRDAVLEHSSQDAARKFMQELAWREYWQRVWFAKDDAIFSDLRFHREDWEHEALVTALVQKTTGVRVVDEAVEQLYSSGYMHNHARMWVAMLACNVAKAHWYDMSRWLFYYLLDGDLASNMLSWQWIAGTNAGKRYVAHQALLNACADDDQRGTFLDIGRDEVGAGAVPEVLQASTPFSYTMEYPTASTMPACDSITLYTPWTLHPRVAQYSPADAEPVLLFDPAWFDRFPVAPAVTDFILALAREYVGEQLQVYVGSVASLQAATGATDIHAIDHPTLRGTDIIRHEPDWLFPEVAGYYPSFFKYWRAVEQHYDV
jgi:deoxyribodipyrimidine photo-lyase